MKHSLVLVDRGAEHVHRWKPSCSCGTWFGVQRRRKQEAVKQYRTLRFLMGLNGRASGYRPLPPTPVDQLPPELRMAVGG